MSEGFGGTWPGSEDDTVDKARAWDAAAAVPPKVADELTALRTVNQRLNAEVERWISAYQISHDQATANGSAASALRSQVSDLRAAAIDALAGWQYIRENHGDLYGVGWDRIKNALSAALLKDPDA